MIIEDANNCLAFVCNWRMAMIRSRYPVRLRARSDLIHRRSYMSGLLAVAPGQKGYNNDEPGIRFREDLAHCRVGMIVI